MHAGVYKHLYGCIYAAFLRVFSFFSSRLLTLSSALSSGGEQELKRHPDLVLLFARPLSRSSSAQRPPSSVKGHLPPAGHSMPHSAFPPPSLENKQKEAAATGREEEEREEPPRDHAGAEVNGRRGGGGAEEERRVERMTAGSQSVEAERSSAVLMSPQKIGQRLAREEVIADEEVRNVRPARQNWTEASPSTVRVVELSEEKDDEKEEEGEVTGGREVFPERTETQEVEEDQEETEPVDLKGGRGLEGAGEGEKHSEEDTRQQASEERLDSTGRGALPPSGHSERELMEAKKLGHLPERRPPASRERRTDEGGGERRAEEVEQGRSRERKAKVINDGRRGRDARTQVCQAKESVSRKKSSGGVVEKSESGADEGLRSRCTDSCLPPVGDSLALARSLGGEDLSPSSGSSSSSGRRRRRKSAAVESSSSKRQRSGKTEDAETLKRRKTRNSPLPQGHPSAVSSCCPTSCVSCSSSSSISVKESEVASARKLQEEERRVCRDKSHGAAVAQSSSRGSPLERKKRRARDGGEDKEEEKTKSRERRLTGKTFSRAYQWYFRRRYGSVLFASPCRNPDPSRGSKRRQK